MAGDTDHGGLQTNTTGSTFLLHELNDLFAWFEANNSTPAQKPTPLPGDQGLTLSPDSVQSSGS